MITYLDTGSSVLYEVASLESLTQQECPILSSDEITSQIECESCRDTLQKALQHRNGKTLRGS